MREKLIDFAGFHGADSGEHISKIFDRVDVIALARNTEGFSSSYS